MPTETELTFEAPKETELSFEVPKETKLTFETLKETKLTFEVPKETELTSDATKEKSLTPNGMSLNPANNISVALDNFDRYVETVSGKDTLRDTAGIVFETSPSATEESINFEAEDDQEVEIGMHVNEEKFVVMSDGSQNKKRRRKFTTIEPYRKKPKMFLSGMIPRSDVIGNGVPNSLFFAKVSDLL